MLNTYPRFNHQPANNGNHRPVAQSIKLKTACGGHLLILPKAQVHLRAHREVLPLLPEAIAKISVPAAGFMSIEVEMGRVIGKTTSVETLEGDIHTSMLFAQRTERSKPSRVVAPDTVGTDTTKMVVLAYPSRSESRTYVLVTSWLGSLAKKEPWDPNISSEKELQECISFWCSNALIHDETIMGEIFESTWQKILEVA